MMAMIRLISEEEATGKVKAVFEDFKRTRGRLCSQLLAGYGGFPRLSRSNLEQV
jgi:hypothetical protein